MTSIESHPDQENQHNQEWVKSIVDGKFKKAFELSGEIADEIFSEKVTTPATPAISAERRAELLQDIERISSDVDRVLKIMDTVRTNYAENFARIKEKHPFIFQKLHRVVTLLEYVNNRVVSFSDEELNRIIMVLNAHAGSINTALNTITADQMIKSTKDKISDYTDIAISKLSDKQKAVLKEVAQELWKELFPESQTDRFIKWASNQKDLEGYQKWLIAPANGIESVVGGVISVFQPSTYKELYQTISTLSGMSYGEWCKTARFAKVMYENASTTDVGAPALSLLFSMVFMFGGASKLLSKAKEIGIGGKRMYSLKAALALRAGAGANEMIKPIPLAAIAGLCLNYINYNPQQNVHTGRGNIAYPTI